MERRLLTAFTILTVGMNTSKKNCAASEHRFAVSVRYCLNVQPRHQPEAEPFCDAQFSSGFPPTSRRSKQSLQESASPSNSLIFPRETGRLPTTADHRDGVAPFGLALSVQRLSRSV